MKKTFAILSVFALLLTAGVVLAKEGKLKLSNEDNDRGRGRSLEDRPWKASSTASTSQSRKDDDDRSRGRSLEDRFWKASSTASSSPRHIVVKKIKCPRGHFIARGWIKKNGRPILIEGCRPLPFGIARLLAWRFGTSTPPVATSTATTTP